MDGFLPRAPPLRCSVLLSARMQVRSLKVQDQNFGEQWFDEIEDRWEYADFKGDQRWRRGWISMDCALYHSGQDRVYLGVTSFDSDIFKAYDRATGRFVDLPTAGVVDEFDAKFHRSLEMGTDGCLYGATALLHDVDRWFDARGGSIFRYDPTADRFERIATPVPHTYIQSIAIDGDRGLIYCLCFGPERLVAYRLEDGGVIDYGPIASGIAGMVQGENVCLDDDGCCWSCWQVTRAWQGDPGVDRDRLLKVDPRLGEQGQMVHYATGLPRPDGRHGYERIEGLFNLGDGAMYASGGNGSIYRIDTETGLATHLFTPIEDRPSRLASLVVAADGYAYGVAGRANRCELLRFDFRHDRYELLGHIVDEGGEPCWQVHHIVMADDGTLYACENDNPRRSGYLWEIRI